MRVANIKSGNLASPMRPRFDDDKYPCYFAEIEKAEKQKDWQWRVGCNYFGFGTDTVYSFKMPKTSGNFTWEYLTGLEFAAELITIFREGGENALKEWIKNGCP